MKLRPCIDIHNGRVKQIVGGSLSDEENQAQENFVSAQDSAWFARLYRDRGLAGGHVILLNPEGSSWYEATRRQAISALAAYPGGLQVGGGIRPDNAKDFLDAGASHVIVTSYVFHDGEISWDRIREMEKAVGRERLVLDLSCRRREKDYIITTNRWQRFTRVPVTLELLERLRAHCAEFLVHAVDVEGKAQGIEEPLVQLLGSFCGCPVTYAGGVGSLRDVETLRRAGQGRLDVTIGSALDLFGGTIPFEQVAKLR